MNDNVGKLRPLDHRLQKCNGEDCSRKGRAKVEHQVRLEPAASSSNGE